MAFWMDNLLDRMQITQYLKQVYDWLEIDVTSRFYWARNIIFFVPYFRR